MDCFVVDLVGNDSGVNDDIDSDGDNGGAVNDDGGNARVVIGIEFSD